MAGGGAGIALAGLAISAAGTAYGAQQAAKNKPAGAPGEPAVTNPQLGTQASNQANEQRQAASAGGTITSPAGGGQLGTSPLTPRKTLLGS